MRQHKRFLAYLMLTAWLMKLAVPAFGQTLSVSPQTGQNRALIICTATGLKYVELPFDIPASEHTTPQDKSLGQTFNAEHCLLCNLPDATVLPNPEPAPRWHPQIATIGYAVSDKTIPPDRILWLQAQARAPPLV